MIDTDRSVRLLHPFPGLAWTEIREAAVECARHGWPVVPGTYQLAEHAAWLGKRDAAGLEPIAEPWMMATTTDPAMALEKWTQRPYSVLLACGAVDVLEVPAGHGERAHPVLAERRLLGPVAVTPSRTWLRFVAPGDTLMPKLADSARLHGSGGCVPLPPTTCAGVPYRWRVSPEDASWRLPSSAAVQRLLIESLPDRST